MPNHQSAPTQIQFEDVVAAAQRLRGHIQRTTCNHSRTLSALLGCEIYLKFENHQFTASFKERGALNCLLQLTAAQRDAGVIAMSAGNHAQALAYHGQRLGVPTCIVMPRFTPNIKVEQTRVLGAEVILEGAQFAETLAVTSRLAEERKLTLVHPFDDPRVIAGQGTVALEMLEQVPELDTLVVPVGGGGLIAGVARVAAQVASDLQVIGVQMERFAGAHRAFHDPAQADPVVAAATGSEVGPGLGLGTVAEGIAVKVPGAQTMPVLRELVHTMLLVSEEQVEQAIFELIEIEKTVVEGAGAAGLAAVQAHPEVFRGRKVGVILCGGNIDMMILSSVLQRGLVRSRRLVRLQVEVPDVPGALAQLTAALAALDSNIISLEHQRAFAGSSVRATGVELVLQLRGQEQEDKVLSALGKLGYAATLLDS